MKLPASNQTKAFTLLEVLVVLVIVTLLSTLIMQGFGYALKFRSKVLSQLWRVQKEELVELWFRKTTASITLRDKLPDEPLSFQGSAESFSTQTLMGLEQPPGLLTQMSWQIETSQDGSVKLWYQSGDLTTEKDLVFSSNGQNTSVKPWLVAEWKQATATFSYLDKQGNWHQDWPPESNKDELPQAIMLNVQKDPQTFFIYSRIYGRKKAKVLYPL